jgi:hypothetical protein
MSIVKKKKTIPDHSLNIWNRHDFAMSGLGKNSDL